MPGRTAFRVALRRAAHQLLDRPLVLDDPVAIPILGAETAARLRTDPSAFERGPADAYLRAFVVVRARCAEQQLEAARAAGVRQYVILGAGLDTFAYRQPAGPPLRIWEVDHPDTQVWKRQLLAAAGIAVPANLAWAAVDFERDSLADRLAGSGFDRSAGAVFAWLGVTMYFDRRSDRRDAGIPGAGGRPARRRHVRLRGGPRASLAAAAGGLRPHGRTGGSSGRAVAHDVRSGPARGARARSGVHQQRGCRRRGVERALHCRPLRRAPRRRSGANHVGRQEVMRRDS